MKPKLIVFVIFLWFFVACAPTAVEPETKSASRPTVIATAVAQATESPTLERQPVSSPTAVRPTRVPPPTPTIVPGTAVA